MKRKLLVIVLCFGLLLTGCQITKSYSIEEITEGGKIDVEKAKASGYVTMAEKEKLGYYTPEVSSNKRVIKKANKQKDEIYKHMTEVIEDSLGRKIRILGMDAPFPYDAVDVSFASLEEPIVKDSVTLGLSDSGYFNEGAIKGETGNGFQQLVVEGLYAMAYRNEIKQMTEYIQKTYPQYEAYAPNMLDAANKINPFISISLATPIKQAERMENAAKEKAEIFSLFKENPNRSDDEWKAIFQQMSSLDYTISVELVLKDSNKLPLDQDANEILDDIKNNPLFSGYYGYASIIESNFQDTKINTGLVSIIQVWNPEIIKFEDFY
ncbi:hypothetical protein [Carnobacterium maltaromaticum]|uniref:hypothetical protein n=1 Tax=Carnobacterium maltaromaticum TaxID=2751 RepID=UPI00191B94B0|nr:hypothetical protein [Carnobacterium maltaromaticum]CAD5900688.1 conserved exported hypothetical protein [Carnobacterium maltaromaticum]